MKLVCPVCQSEHTLEAAMNDVAARQAVAKAFQLTEIGSLLIGYVQLFKPAKQALSMARLAKLLDELIPMIKQGQITRNGSTYAAPQAYWSQAIETMLASRDKLSLPIKSHGYLLEIIAGYSNKAAAQAEAKAEANKRQNSRYGHVVTNQKSQSDHVNDTVKMVAEQKNPKAEMPEETRLKIKSFASKGKANG